MADRRSSLASGCTYDVFLSFRGKDTRETFTSHLYKALLRSRIRTFIDDEGLRRGEVVSQKTLIDSIEESRIGVVVFSHNYASSTWCLDELVKIIECVKSKGRLVIPVFYDVDPSDVRHLRGSYGKALAKHMDRSMYSQEKLQKWAWALREAANIAGFNIKNRGGCEAEFIENIVEAIFSKIKRTPLRVANYPVGLESRLEELNSLLDVGSDREVKMVGIWGMGGIGKTTLARAVVNVIADNFEGVSFLHVGGNSIKHGLVQLQERLLSDILGDKNIKSDDVNKGVSILKSRLCPKKVLVVLDDVDDSEQLEVTAGGCDWFGAGSRVIITTRDKHLLDCHGVRTQFEVKRLNHQEALELFSWNAFKKSNVIDPSYVEYANCALHYAKGLPLALEVIGSNLYGKMICEWQSTFRKYKKIPASETVHEVLRVSYEDLDQVQKTIFLDIACFLKGYRLEYVSDILPYTRGLGPDSVIGALVDKSLIWIECDVLCMHDLIQDMGREIVLQQSQSRPFKGTDINKVMSLKNFKKIWNTRHSTFLKDVPDTPKFLDCSGYLSSFPSDIHPGKVVMLNMDSILGQPLKFEHLTHMGFKSCKFVRELPDLSGVPNVTELRLDHCENLIEIHDPVGFLDKLRLRRLSVKGCAKIKTFAHAMKLKHLHHLNLSGCSSLQTYPKILGRMENVRNANLVGTIIKELPKHEMMKEQSFSEFQFFSMYKGQRLSLTVSSSVTHLDLSACNLSDQFLVYLVCFPNLKNLNLRANNFTILPACIKECSHLSYLSVDDCKKLRDIEGIPPNIELFRATNCTSLTPISSTILLSQALHEAGNTQFILPGARIPEWFDHFNEGGSVSFWVRKKFPDIALCFVLGSSDMLLRKFKLELRMVINGKYQIDFNYNYFQKLVTDHIMLFDLRSQMANNELDEILLDNEWNHVQVSCVDEPSIKEIMFEKEIIRCIGIYVYKPQSRVKDIRFANPYSGKRKDNSFCCSDDFELNCCQLLKRQREFLDMGAFKTRNIQQEANLGSIAQNVPKRCRTIFEDRGKYSTVYHDAGMKWDIEWLSLLPSLQPLEGTNMILNPIVSKKAFSNDKDVKLNKSCSGGIHLGKSKRTSTSQGKPGAKVCVQSKQTHTEKTHTQVPEIRGNLCSVSQEANCDLTSMEQFDSSFNHIAVKATDASLESETTALSLVDPETNTGSVKTMITEETKKALQILRDSVSKRFSLLLDPGRSKFMKIILEFLLSLSEDDGISLRMRSVILQLSRSFTQWSRDYAAASVKHELATADMLKFDKLDVDIEANFKKLKEVNLLEDELCSRLACLQERKRELEEHICAVNEETMEFRSPRGTVSEKKTRTLRTQECSKRKPEPEQKFDNIS